MIGADLVLPDPSVYELPDLVRAVIEAAGSLDLDEAEDLEHKAEALRLLHRQERDGEGLARRYGAMALTLSRRMARDLPPPGKGGRGQRIEDPLGLDRNERKVYRDLLLPTDEEFLAFCETSDTLTRSALAAHGRQLARERRGNKPSPPQAEAPGGSAPLGGSPPCDPETGEPADEQEHEQDRPGVQPFPDPPGPRSDPFARELADKLRPLVAAVHEHVEDSNVARQVHRLVSRALLVANAAL